MNKRIKKVFVKLAGYQALVLGLAILFSTVAFAENIEVYEHVETMPETVISEPVNPVEGEKTAEFISDNSDLNEETDSASPVEKMNKNEEEPSLVEQLVSVRLKLKKMEEAEGSNVKENFDFYTSFENEDEKELFVSTLLENDLKSFEEYKDLKDEEEALVNEIAKIAEEDPDAAEVMEIEFELEFAEAEMKEAEAEIAALEAEAENDIQPAKDNKEFPVEEVETNTGEEMPEATATNSNELTEENITTENDEPLVVENEEETEPSEELTDEQNESIDEEAIIEDDKTASKGNAEDVASEGEVDENLEETEETEDEEVADEGIEEPEEEIEAEPTEEKSNVSVSIWLENLSSGEIKAGDQLCIHGEINGAEDGMELTYQWERTQDGNEWEPIEGATAVDYIYTIDEGNCMYAYRLSVSF